MTTSARDNRAGIGFPAAMSDTFDAEQHWPDLAGRLIERDGTRAHVLPVRVYFEDTDF